MTKSAIDTLTDEFVKYLDANNLPHECADELLAHPDLTVDQRAWLNNFCDTWNAASDADPEFFDKQTIVEG